MIRETSKMKSVLIITLLCVIFVTVKAETSENKTTFKCNKDEVTSDCIFRVNKETEKYEKENDEDGSYSAFKQVQLFEGDIVWTKKLKAEIAERKIRAQNGMEAFDAHNTGKWPNARVPYKFAPGFQYRSVVYQAIADYNKRTCIRVVPHTPEEERRAGGYINFIHGGGCYSQIGKVGGKQDVSLGNGCNYKGTAIHEIMHAIGFWHEQSRLDRDNYITIYWNNIPKNLWFAFQKYRASEASTLGEPYDKKSVMHYGNYAFSTNGQPTIISKSNRMERLGTQFEQTGLSAIDERQVNKHYQCGKTTVVTKPPITTNCKNMYPFCTALPKWCSNSFVRSNCKKTCNLCTKVTVKPPTNCVDRSPHCPAWAKVYCVTGSVWVKNNCKKSCGTC